MTKVNYNKLGYIIAVGVVVFGMTACTPESTISSEENNENRPGETVETVEKQELKIIEVKTEKFKEETSAYNIEVELPILSGFTDEVFQLDENKQMSDYAAQFTGAIKEMALEIKEEGYLTSPYYAGITYDVLLKNEAYLSLAINYSEYTGGAHGNYFSEYIIYDIAENKRIELKDIMIDGVEYMTVLNDAVTEAIQAARNESEYGDQLHSWYEGVTEELLSFSIESEGLGVHFQPYEIGPYAEGAPTFIIPYERLEEVLDLKKF